MRSDVLIIGAGGAGLMAALSAKEAGASVRVISKEYPTRSQTCMAQGGINAALGNVGEDSVEAHIQNTLKSAHGEADEQSVRFMCEEAPKIVSWLDSIGVCFSRTKDAKIAQRTLGGASAARACYAQDYTGLKILHTLYDRCNAKGIEMLNEKYLLDLIKDENERVCGAKFLNIRSGELEIYRASCVILATGGYSRIYAQNSTNSTASTGDGIAAAKRAGAELLGMEFVQFHPTALKNSSILISESARGEGGYLLNSKGERFTNELAPRDEVSRGIDAEISKGEEIFLDIRHLGEKLINEGLPQERKLAKLYENVDPVDELIPIRPVAHYTMGGIEVDKNAHTNIEGLYACGECSNPKVHGANRLGGNSLLEILVFGKQAGINGAKEALLLDRAESQEEQKRESFEFKSSQAYALDFYAIREEVGNLFYKDVGIVRSKKQLLHAKERIEELHAKLPLMGPHDNSLIYNTNLVEFLEFQNILELCDSVVTAALKREVSAGAHFIV